MVALGYTTSPRYVAVQHHRLDDSYRDTATVPQCRLLLQQPHSSCWCQLPSAVGFMQQSCSSPTQHCWLHTSHQPYAVTGHGGTHMWQPSGRRPPASSWTWRYTCADSQVQDSQQTCTASGHCQGSNCVGSCADMAACALHYPSKGQKHALYNLCELRLSGSLSVLTTSGCIAA